MKRLACLMCAVVAVGCGIPNPVLPRYAGEVEGVHYYIEDGAEITLEEAALSVRVTVEAWGKSMEEVEGLRVAYYVTPFYCVDGYQYRGCYTDNSYTLIQLRSWEPSCIFVTPIAHEFWHLFYAEYREPSTVEYAEIDKVRQAVMAHLTPLCKR